MHLYRRWIPIVLISLCLGMLIGASEREGWAKSKKVPQVKKKMIPEGEIGPPAPATWTIYVDGGSGRSGSAEDMNELHAVMNRKGWRFADLEVRLVNGDLRGYLVTYVAHSGATP